MWQHFDDETIFLGGCRVCVIAGNISPIDVITHVPILCEEAEIPYVYVPSKEVSWCGPCFVMLFSLCFVLLMLSLEFIFLLAVGSLYGRLCGFRVYLMEFWCKPFFFEFRLRRALFITD